MGRRIWVNDWEKSLTRDDRVLLRRAKEAAPERMAEMEDQLRRWTYEGWGSNQRLPDLIVFVEQGREHREMARHAERKQAEALSSSPCFDIHAEHVRISAAKKPA
jgi:hypothetical protein